LHPSAEFTAQDVMHQADPLLEQGMKGEALALYQRGLTEDPL
jgi:hypothetical protein